jgi:hypothetical protein
LTGNPIAQWPVYFFIWTLRWSDRFAGLLDLEHRQHAIVQRLATRFLAAYDYASARLVFNALIARTLQEMSTALSPASVFELTGRAWLDLEDVENWHYILESYVGQVKTSQGAVHPAFEAFADHCRLRDALLETHVEIDPHDIERWRRFSDAFRRDDSTAVAETMRFVVDAAIQVRLWRQAGALESGLQVLQDARETGSSGADQCKYPPATANPPSGMLDLSLEP